jgi:8-oxo-dGTP diphosphatase
MRLGVVALAFVCEITGGEEHTSTEADRVAWLSRDEAMAAMPEARAIRVTDALSRAGPFVRIHNGDVILESNG